MISNNNIPRWLRHVGGLLGLIAILTLLFLRAEMVSPQAHYRYLENLRSLQQADIQINASILATHAELVHNYDDLVTHLGKARETLQIADAPPAFLSDAAQTAIHNKTRELHKSLNDKADLIDQYRRSNSIFRNSVDYFPRASASFLTTTNQNRRIKYYGTFVRDILTISRAPTQELIDSLKLQLQQIDKLEVPTAERDALNQLLPHAESILYRHPEIDSLVHNIINAGTTRQFEELMHIYTDGHEESLRIAGYYRLLLFGAGILLVIYVVYAYARIDRNQRELASTNQELRHQFAALRRSEFQTRLYSTVFTNAAEGMTITDGNSKIVAVNPAFCSITGYSALEVIGRKASILNSGRQNPAFYKEMWEKLNLQGKWHGEIWNRRKDGSSYPEWLSISAIRNEAGETTHFIGIFTDITERKLAEERIQHLAHHDALTGLPNRLLLDDRLAQAILKSRRSGKSTAILFLDLDRFKNINDTLGHEVGDSLLIEAAERGKAVLRETDTISRLGGDEFVVILPEIDSPQDASQVARKLSQGLAQPYKLAGHDLTVTGSIGIALYPDDGTTASELLRNADTAMYRAKEEGRNLFRFYSADMNLASLSELLLESHLRNALKNSELLMHYQPKYDALTGRLVAAEALMRWRHPEHGLIPPARFIPLAEECGLISTLGEWALHTTCRQLRSWLDAGLNVVPVAINVSAQQFTHQNIPALVASALAESKLPPSLIELELTESLFVRNASQITKVLEQLRTMKINMSIDDFGTGYSSLSYLKNFPVNALKVDRSFVQDIDGHENQVQLAPAIIAMAHSMGMYVIAEGVETNAQREFLSMHECDQFQGFLFAYPMAAEEFGKHLESKIAKQ